MLPLPRARPDLRDASIAVLVPEGDTIVRKGDPVSVVRAWAQGLGFEGLSYFAPARDRTLPCLWEGGSIVPHGRLARFLRDAAACGIRSGVAIPLGASSPRAIVAFDASPSTLAPAQRSAILARLGDMLWVAHAVHASRHATSPTPDASPSGLSQREHACPAMSARGLTSRDIGAKLGIATRTVDFHIGNVLVKLAASNRHEAIAKAIAQGWLQR